MLIVKHAGRYLVSGGMLTIVGYVSIILLTSDFGINPYWANFYVYLTGIFVSYYLNARIVFGDLIYALSFLKFLLSFFISYLANLFALVFSMDYLLLGHWKSQLIATAIYTCIHFVLSRAYVFEWQSKKAVR